MKILAASLVDAAEAFLHPGYISAYPRAFEPAMAYAPSEPQLQLDLAEAFRLKGEALSSAAAAASADVALPTAAAASLAPWLTVMAVMLGGCAALALAYLIGDQWRRTGARVAWVGASLASLLALMACGHGGAPVPAAGPPATTPPAVSSPPATGATASPYQNPRDATLGLMHGVLYDAISNVGRPVQQWDDIRPEVGLPHTQLTPGQRHALAHYQIDGWGNELWLVPGDPYQLISAGPDGAFRTGDDLSMTVPPCNDENWDMNRRAFYVRKVNGRYVVLFHRWTGGHFRYANERPARALTGSALFDLFTVERLPPEQQAAVARVYETLAANARHEPLVLQVFRPTG